MAKAVPSWMPGPASCSSWVAQLWRTAFAFSSGLLLQAPALVWANTITPSSTQGFGTTVTTTGGDNYTITGGTISGEKLLHGFGTFSIPAGGSASFDGSETASRIQSIYGVVSTGASTLDGALRIINFNRNDNGFVPSLFLMNPNGFVLGTGFSTNSQQLSLFAADGMLLGCSQQSTFCANAADEYELFNTATTLADVNDNFSWSNSDQFWGLVSDAAAQKSITVAATNLSLAELSLSAATIVFEPGSVVSIKKLNVVAPWFDGAVVGDSGDLVYGRFSQGSSGSRGIFTADLAVAQVGPLNSTDNMLLDTDALYTPTSMGALQPGSVNFAGAIRVNPVTYESGSRLFNSDQAEVQLVAKQAFVGAMDSPGGPTSPFGPNAAVSRSDAPSYSGLYYGFGATIEIDPALHPPQYISLNPVDPGTDPEEQLDSLEQELAQDNEFFDYESPAEWMDASDTAEEALAEGPSDRDANGDSDDDGLLAFGDAFDLGDGEFDFDADPDGTDSAGDRMGDLADGGFDAPPAVNSVALPFAELGRAFSAAEQGALEKTAAALGLGGGAVEPLSPQRAQQSLRQAMERVRNQPQVQGRVGSPSLLAAAGAGAATKGMLPLQFNRAAYNPAILQVRFTEAKGRTTTADTDAFLDLTLIPAEGEIIGQRVEVSTSTFASQLKELYSQLSRQEDLRTSNPGSASRRLYEVLLAPLVPDLTARRITTLLIGADRGLQGVPYAALHSGRGFLGEQFAFSLTPSLSLTNLTPPDAGQKRLLAAGASQFEGLAALPLVPQELGAIVAGEPSDALLNMAFTPATIEVTAADPRYDRIHLATHAEFMPGGPTKSKLYSGKGPVSLTSLATLRRQRRGVPLDLIVLSACRTALGDSDSELGFAGLALQAGARSAIGTLWYVDDVATSAYFIQAYRYLQQGLPKAEALQFTRRDFIGGRVQLVGDQILGGDGQVLLSGLSVAQQRRVANGLANSYFWAGVELLGSPW